MPQSARSAQCFLPLFVKLQNSNPALHILNVEIGGRRFDAHRTLPSPYTRLRKDALTSAAENSGCRLRIPASVVSRTASLRSAAICARWAGPAARYSSRWIASARLEVSVRGTKKRYHVSVTHSRTISGGITRSAAARYHCGMKVITGRVVGGKIEFETDLREGTPVAVLAAGDGGFQLTADEEGELFSSLQDIRSGKYEDGYELLRELKH